MYSIGIDIGTTNSCVVVADHRNYYNVVQVDGGDLLPSMVNYSNPDHIKVGKAADVIRDFKAGKAVKCNKLVLGHKFDDPMIEDAKVLCNAKVVTNNKGYCEFDIPGMNRRVSTEDVTVELLRTLYSAALAKIDGQTPKEVWITIPAKFTQIQKGIMRNAAKRVITDCPVNFLFEPSAAAIAYTKDNKLTNGHILVYDLGGGTFDVSIIRVQNGSSYEILKTDGHPTIGGSLFDLLLLKYVSKKFREYMRDLNDEDEEILPDESDEVYSASKYKLLKICSEAKRQLSGNTLSVPLDINSFFDYVQAQRGEDSDDSGIDNDYELVLWKEELEKVLENPIRITIEITLDCIKKCGLTVDKIDRVVLVGGSSNIPLVSRLLKEVFGNNKVGCDINTNTCVAVGAALRGQESFSNMEERNHSYLIQKSSYDIAVELGRGRFSTLIPKDSDLPVTGSKVYHLSANNPGFVISSVFEKNGEGHTGYELIQKICVEDEDFYDRSVRIEVKYSLTRSGELTVRFMDLDRNCVIREEALVL